jgi:PAS domain S-box-containing protein
MDVTAQRLAERSLQIALQEMQTLKEQFQLAVDTIPGLVWSALPDGYIDFLNQRWLEYTGLTLAEASGWGWQVAIHPEDVVALVDYWKLVLASGKPAESEARLRRFDGVYRWFSFHAVPLYDGTGKLTKWYGQTIDMDDRKRAGEQLRRSEAYLAEAQRLSLTGSFGWNISSGRIYWSQETFRIFEYDPATAPTLELIQQRTHPEDRPLVQRVIDRVLQERRDFDFEHRLLIPDGSVKHIRVVGHASSQEEPGAMEFVGAVTDVSERKRAEEEHRTHLWFLESMDRVNRAIQGTNDPEQMMSDVLDAVIAIFNCDRAWLVYPCDPQASSWKVPMGHSRPEFPGAFILGLELPVDGDLAKVFQTVRASSGPVRFGPGSEHPLPADATQRFSIQSQMAMAIRPKMDQPYMLGLHQCSYARVWMPQEERLFQEIGRRLEDALTSLLMFRNLRESERKLEEAQSLTHVGYWERDPDTDVITWSDETYRIFGLEPQGRTLNLPQLPELIHPEDQQIMVQAVANALRGVRRYDVEYRVVRPNGEVRLVHSQGEVTRDESGRPRRMFGSVQDITERKRAEQRLMAQHTVTQILAEVATLEDATPRILEAVCEFLEWDLGVLWCVDRESAVLRCIEVWHKQSLEFRQFEAASRKVTFSRGIGLPGRVWASRAPVYIPDVVHNADFTRAAIAAREGLHAGFGFPILLGTDVLGAVEFFSREIRQPDEDLLNTMATLGSQIGQFIERKRAEAALRHAQMELAHVARVATLGEMTASIAHEINQPLAAVVNNASACLRWLAAGNLEEARNSAALVIADGHRAGEIIARIRALAKKAPARKEWLDINQTIREVIALAHSEVQRGGVSLETRLSDDVHYLPLISADRVQLQQVILNLFVNAIEAMSEVDNGARELLVYSGTAESQRVLVAVRDSGPGLDPKTLDRLFDAFYTTKPQGMGMGLAISRSIIEAHGGRLWATTNQGRGATFQFTLPTGSEKAR